uniref:short-chain fatty acyl-CoA regulator family protein n=1 Tax=uncultured Sphingomonas sp. TaxID=158754 RepID=UPI0035C9F379
MRRRRVRAVPTPVGIACRICPRSECEQRAFAPSSTLRPIDPNARAVVPYMFVQTI